MEGRSWTLTKVAVFGSMVLLLAVAVFYVYHSYTDAPKPWNPGALTVHWSDGKYLTGQDEQIKGFLFQYGVNNNTSRDYEVHKEAVTIMTSTKDGEDSLIPADTNYSLGRDSFFLPARQTSLIEVRFDGECNAGENAENCFNEYTRDLAKIILFDKEIKYRIDLPKNPPGKMVMH